MRASTIWLGVQRQYTETQTLETTIPCREMNAFNSKAYAVVPIFDRNIIILTNYSSFYAI